ncbi:MAG TPA: tRNA (adenosine(37)-N6)-threonylcarbamoyltransferase complex transferase subunit TsaD [Clostridia bacterium]|nr:tRNA (adenosine(37)-N6)-threonylcarbamoyltransferase complex transferase subunit TsaD [Clostridia bacterium]
MTYFMNMKAKVKDIVDKEEILVLGVETSCDETSAAVIRNGREILSHKIASQIDLHKKYGGVVPEIASRKHVETINPLIDETMKEAGIPFDKLDAIAVTHGPGLVGALLVGVSTAKALAYGLSIPLVGIHHIEGHISANYIEHPELKPPFLCLVASGGHSHLIWVEDYGEYEIVGQTMDDAAGEAYDKVARTLGLGYPGGPLIDKLAQKGDPHYVEFPRPYIRESHYNFSFSGLKTAVINYLHTMDQRGEAYAVEDIAASFQQAVVDVLADKTIRAAMDKGTDKIVLAGGVAANSALRARLDEDSRKKGISLYYPTLLLCTDNGAMIGSAGYYKLKRGIIADLNLNANPGLSITI